jgi:hypothetical protein
MHQLRRHLINASGRHLHEIEIGVLRTINIDQYISMNYAGIKGALLASQVA